MSPMVKGRVKLVALLAALAMLASACWALQNAFINKTQVVHGEAMTAVIQMRDLAGVEGRPTVWVLMPDDWSVGALKDFSSATLGQHPLGTNFSAKTWIETPGNCVLQSSDLGGPAPSGFVWKALRVTDGDILSSDPNEVARVRIQLVAGSTSETVGLRFITGVTVDDDLNPGTVESAACASVYGPAVTVVAP